MVLIEAFYVGRKSARQSMVIKSEWLNAFLIQNVNNVATLLNKEKGVVGNYESTAQMNARSNQLVTVRKHGIMQIRSLRRCLKLLTSVLLLTSQNAKYLKRLLSLTG